MTALRDHRLARLRTAMAGDGIDVLALAGNAWRSDYLRYALDITPMEGIAIALVTDTALQLLTGSPQEAERLASAWPDLSVRCVADPVAEAERSLAALSCAQRVALAPSQALPWRLARGAHGQSMARATALLDDLMVRKSAAEADAVERAAHLADEGYLVFRQACRIGRPEHEAVAETEAWFRSRGCPENFMIMGSGGVEFRGMRPPSDKPMGAGELVTTELTPCPEGYYAQICRTLVLGQASAAQRQAFAVFAEALEAGIAQVRPGQRHSDVARAQNDVFRKHGLGEYVGTQYTRVRGHGLGLFVDGPHVLEDVDLVLEENMTLIVHPNTYHPQSGYMVLGDSVRVTRDGCRVLTRTPRELFCQ
jgi:Xaa-Pro aminopeptidase